MAKLTSPDEGLLLALLNTTPTVAGERIDQLARADDARAWLASYGGTSAEDLELLRSTRDTLQALVNGQVAATALAPALSGVSYNAVLGDSGISWELALPRDHAVAARAAVAWDILQREAPGRVRACENAAECSLFLIDHSKSNSARWCSMSNCGNRMKARRHYERRRNTQPAK
ncbi:CGNR zinc finger domain-containing protein [Kribbella sp. NPDC048915]|uniref:CGNR zinc finger domain-containing protein n=1 Tax=Kribbella sp. NPDC048915 TaxID=3155148 RepID=UPI0033C465A2